MLRGLPPFPALEPLKPVATAAGIWTLPWGRAPGPESWTAEDLRLWPPHLVSALVALFRAVEQFGRWPLGLAAADVVLLPKPHGCAYTRWTRGAPSGAQRLRARRKASRRISLARRQLGKSWPA